MHDITLDDYYKLILNPLVNKYREKWGIGEKMYDLRNNPEFCRKYDEAFGTKKGNPMNNDDRLECLRLAIEAMKGTKYTTEQLLRSAKVFYNWVYEQEKVNSLTFEKIHNERTEK